MIVFCLSVESVDKSPCPPVKLAKPPQFALLRELFSLRENAAWGRRKARGERAEGEQGWTEATQPPAYSFFFRLRSQDPQLPRLVDLRSPLSLLIDFSAARPKFGHQGALCLMLWLIVYGPHLRRFEDSWSCCEKICSPQGCRVVT